MTALQIQKPSTVDYFGRVDFSSMACHFDYSFTP